jgi:hypothetical protein
MVPNGLMTRLQPFQIGEIKSTMINWQLTFKSIRPRSQLHHLRKRKLSISLHSLCLLHLHPNSQLNYYPKTQESACMALLLSVHYLAAFHPKGCRNKMLSLCISTISPTITTGSKQATIITQDSLSGAFSVRTARLNSANSSSTTDL